MNKDLEKLAKELVYQMTGNKVEDTQEGDYQIAIYYLEKAINYTCSCMQLKKDIQLTTNKKHCFKIKDRIINFYQKQWTGERITEAKEKEQAEKARHKKCTCLKD